MFFQNRIIIFKQILFSRLFQYDFIIINLRFQIVTIEQIKNKLYNIIIKFFIHRRIRLNDNQSINNSRKQKILNDK